MITRKTVQRFGLPLSYKKWWLRKFEFTQRHAVHEHEISKRVFMFPRYDKIREKLEDGETLEGLELADFVDVEFKGERLASYPSVRYPHIFETMYV